MSDVLLPQALDGKDWKILESTGQDVSVDIRQHVAAAVPALTEGLEQARYHELARVLFSVGHEPNLKTHEGILAQSIEELRLDCLLEARGIPQNKRLEDRDWSLAPSFDPATLVRDRVRFLLETVWPAQEDSSPLLTNHWLPVFDDVKRELPDLIEALQEVAPALQQAVQRGEDGLKERDELAERLQRLIDPPPPPPKPVVSSSLSSETLEKIREASKPKPAPEPAATRRKSARLKKIEKPAPEPEPKAEDEELSTPESADQDAQGGENDDAQLENGNQSDGTSGSPSGSSDGEEDRDAAPQESGGESDASGSSEDEEEVDDEEGSSESGAAADDAELEDDGDGEEEESKPEEYAAEYEEVEEDEAERAEREALEKQDQEIAKDLHRGGSSAVQVYDPQKPIGHGGSAKIGHMLIHDHVKTATRTHMVRKTRGARDRGVIPTQFHRYTMDKAIFSARRPGGTILIDGSGSMNWDPDKLEVLISQLPTATVAIYHGSEIDWAATTRLGTSKLLQEKQQDLWKMLVKGDYSQDEYDAANGPYQEALEAFNQEAKTLRREVQNRGAMAGVGIQNRLINGTLCVLGKEGRWGPLEHGLGGGNDVDVEALQWLAAQPAPRVWISDGEVCGGFYWSLFGTAHPYLVDEMLKHLCDELCRRHRITRAPTVKDALKVLRVNLPSLVKLGI